MIQISQTPPYSKAPAYYSAYFDLVKHETFLEALDLTLAETLTAFEEVSRQNKTDFKYAEGKWTAKELMLHIIDVERILCYRALRLSRKDSTPLAGFDEDEYARNAEIERFTLAELEQEFSLVRENTKRLFSKFSDEMLNFEGSANGSIITALGIAFMISAHNRHHLNVLKERYLD